MAGNRRLVVIGGGPGGLSAARFAKRLRPDWHVTLIRAQEKSVIPCALPYALDGTIRAEQFVKSDEKLLGGPGIELVVERVETVDADKRTVTTASGRSFPYDWLVLATGAVPIRPPIPGADLPGTFTVKDKPDIEALAQAGQTARSVAVIGAGYVGLEVALAFQALGKEVHVIEIADRPLANVASGKPGAMAAEELAAHDIRLHLSRRADEILGDERVTGVKLDSGETIYADIVVFAVGVRADTELFRQIGAEIGRFGVVVDETMATSVDRVYAAGDCIEYPHMITGQPSYGPLATNAVMQGKTAAINITGGRRAFPALLNPSVTRLYEKSYGFVGLGPFHARDAGIEYVMGEFAGHTREPSFPGATPLWVRLVFRRSDRRLIGGEVVGGEGVAERVDLLTLAIMKEAVVEDLAAMHFSGHPPQTDVPARMSIVRAAEAALDNL